MDYMICFYALLVCPMWTRSKAVDVRELTSGKHALHEVGDIAENDSISFWSALLPPDQRFDLNTLQYGFRYISIGILAGVEDCTEE